MHATAAALRTAPAYPESDLPPPVRKLERPAALVKAQSLAFLMFEKPDLPASEAFLADFGMHRVSRTANQLVMRGADEPAIYVANRGPRARYVGAAFTVAGEAELALLEKQAVTLLVPNLPETHYALLGAQAAGIVSPVNPMLDVGHIASIVEETAAEALLAFAPAPESALWDKAMEVVDRCARIRTVFAVSIGPYAGAGYRADLSGARKPARAGVSIVHFHEALDAEPGDRLVSGRTIAQSDICSYFHTGGTTGLPKVATHAHLNETFVAWMLDSLMQRESVILCGLPLFHVNGAMVTGLAAFHSGSEVGSEYPGHGPGVPRHQARHRRSRRMPARARRTGARSAGPLRDSGGYIPPDLSRFIPVKTK